MGNSFHLGCENAQEMHELSALFRRRFLIIAQRDFLARMVDVMTRERTRFY